MRLAQRVRCIYLLLTGECTVLILMCVVEEVPNCILPVAPTCQAATHGTPLALPSDGCFEKKGGGPGAEDIQRGVRASACAGSIQSAGSSGKQCVKVVPWLKVPVLCVLVITCKEVAAKVIIEMILAAVTGDRL